MGGRRRAARGRGSAGRRADRSGAERRLLAIAAWMRERTDPFSRDELREAFPDDYRGSPAAFEKKFGRDKASLVRLGVALRQVEDDETRYFHDPTAHRLRVALEPAEAAVVWMAGRAALAAGGHPLQEDLEAALRKLAVGARDFPPNAAPLELARAEPPPEALHPRLELLAEAVERRRRLHLVYRAGAEGTETVRDVDVYGYGLRRGEWFLVGHCHLREAPRLFLLRRVVTLRDRPEPSDHRCAVPLDARGNDYRVPRDFDLDAWRLQEPWEYLAHPPLEARVRLRGALARSARALLPRATVTAGPDGARLATLTVRHLDGLVRQVLAWGPDAELVAPAEGRARLVAALDRLDAALAAEVAR
jgi:proteasome accessory factor B